MRAEPRFEVVAVFQAVLGCPLPLPLYWLAVQAGFPSPAADHADSEPLDLNSHLVRHPASTYYLRAAGCSMIGAGIHSGDLLVVDRLLEPKDGSVVIAVLDAELTVKRLCLTADGPLLVAEHPDYPPIRVDKDASFEIWGVVTTVVHSLL